MLSLLKTVQSDYPLINPKRICPACSRYSSPSSSNHDDRMIRLIMLYYDVPAIMKYDEEAEAGGMDRKRKKVVSMM